MELFNNSFLPSTIRLWNKLPSDIRQSSSLSIFKSKLLTHYGHPRVCPDWYNFGDRYASVLHTRLRLGSSQLNSHLFKIGVKANPSCQCGAKYEDSRHFIFSCSRYTTSRSKLHTIILKYAPFSLQTVLYGSKDCTTLENIQIFSAVQDYIILSNRFSQAGIG